MIPAASFVDDAPAGSALTDYDRQHIKLYVRLLDSAADGADWQEAVSILFGIDPTRETERAWRIYSSHLARARWMTEHGYHQLRQSARN